ncbi:hypothetical protein B0J18DRAFT_437206 [Chaetomium sp. MPI-SDFR-AT-0129]|nr:hypothetical protein B0J18DRAFT_437206 [Chaetomium sp. MPI-SDFR-AT-0129]
MIARSRSKFACRPLPAMPSITQLPCEVVGLVLKSLDHPRYLCSALLTCRHFYSSFKESHGVRTSILRHQVTPALLPYAVAVAEAAQLPRPLSSASISSLLDELYKTPARLAARMSTLPASTVQSMSLTHDTIHTLAMDFATKAHALIPPFPTCTPVLSPSEYFRFCRAFYRVELFYIMSREYEFEALTQSLFFSRHHPWENEQLASVYEYLEARFAEASLDVLMHDVDFGEGGVDYLTTGAENGWRQAWLSHGVLFIYDLTKADSYEARHEILVDAYYSPHESEACLPEALQEVITPDVSEDTIVAQYSETHLQMIPQLYGHQIGNDKVDMDPGPYRAWREENKDQWLEDSCMHESAAWLRERAYVFWDDDRLRNLPRGFGDSPGERSLGYTEEEFEEMLDSFDERSQISLKGGSGYWSKGDTSRIEWTEWSSLEEEETPSPEG